LPDDADYADRREANQNTGSCERNDEAEDGPPDHRSQHARIDFVRCAAFGNEADSARFDDSHT